MARNFDGVDDQLSFGSDASIDNIFAAAPFTGSFAFWVQRNATGPMALFYMDIAGAEGWGMIFRGSGGAHTISTFVAWSGSAAAWETSSTFNVTGSPPIHVVMTYDGSSTSNNMEYYINGGSAESVETTAPVGTINGDASCTLLTGLDHLGTLDGNQQMGWIVVTKTIMDAEQRNRHRWWGRIGGAPLIQHPLVTDKVTNEGTGTADAAPTGTTMVSLPIVQRPGGMCMMGCGI